MTRSSITRYRWNPMRSLTIVALLMLAICLCPAMLMNVSPGFRPVTQRQIASLIGKHHRDQRLVKAIISVESSWRPSAVSSKGAIGLMQVMPSSVRMVGLDYTREDLLCPERNIEAGTRILKYYQARYDLRRALHHYSGGTSGYYEKVMRRMRGMG